MASAELIEAFIDAIRTLVLLGLPLVLACVVGGSLMGIIQSATSIHEPVLGYAARLGAVALVFYLMLPSFTQSVLSLAERVFR